VTWLAARMSAQAAISAGEFVAVYGYATVLVVPVSFFTEGGYDLSRGLVTARTVMRFLALEPDSAGREAASDGPLSPSTLRDQASGVEVAPGRLTALVSAGPSPVRGGGRPPRPIRRSVESAATWGAIRLDEIDLTQVRRRILVADNEADLLAGPLRDVIRGKWDRDEETIGRAAHPAMAQDIVRGLPDGLDSPVDAQAATSPGQRQRIRLVRALLADP
jgi:ABC-type multidrug transport system fused ATPase/permease subunit